MNDTAAAAKLPTGHLNVECNIIWLLKKKKNFAAKGTTKKTAPEGLAAQLIICNRKRNSSKVEPCFHNNQPKKRWGEKRGENGSHRRANENPQI